MADLAGTCAEDSPRAARMLSKQASLNRSRAAIRDLAEASELLRSQGELLTMSLAGDDDDTSLPTPEVQKVAVQRFLSRRLSLKAVQDSSKPTTAESPPSGPKGSCGRDAATAGGAAPATAAQARMAADKRGSYSCDGDTVDSAGTAVAATASTDGLTDRTRPYLVAPHDGDEGDATTFDFRSQPGTEVLGATAEATL